MLYYLSFYKNSINSLNFRLSYTRHLGDLITNLGNEGVYNLQKILENLVFLLFLEKSLILAKKL